MKTRTTENLQSATFKKEENTEQILPSKIMSENLEAQRQGKIQQQTSEAIREQALLERHENLKTSHDKFMQDADELIEKKKKYNENLQSLLNDLRAGKEISLESMQSFVKTEEQINEERKQERVLKEHKQQYNQHYQEMYAHEEKQKSILEKYSQQNKFVSSNTQSTEPLGFRAGVKTFF